MTFTDAILWTFNNLRPAPQPQTFLIVEDNAADAELFLHDVKKIGGRGHIVHSGAGAFEALRAKDYDVALLDFRLPDTTGWLLHNRIKSQTPKTRIIFVLGDPSDLAEAKPGSSFGVIVKGDSIADGLRQQLKAHADPRSAVALFGAWITTFSLGYLAAKPDLLKGLKAIFQ